MRPTTSREHGALPIDALRNLVANLTLLLKRQRERGRTPLHEAMAGMMVQAGEAQGLAHELSLVFDPAPDVPAPGQLNDPLSPAFERARAAFDLRPAEVQGLLLSWAVEYDGRFTSLVAFLNDHAARTRPTLGLIAELSGLIGHPQEPIALLDRPLFRDGLLTVEGDGPVPTLSVRLAPEVRAALSGIDPPSIAGIAWHPWERDFGANFAVDLNAARTRESWKRTNPAETVLIVVGEEGSGRTSAARLAVQPMGLGLVEVELTPDGLPAILSIARREARWRHSGILLRQSSGKPVDWPAVWSLLQRAELRVILEIPAADRLSASLSCPRDVLLIDLPTLDPLSRRQVWKAQCSRICHGDTLDQLSARYPMTPKQIAAALSVARIRRGRSGGGLYDPWRSSELEHACQELLTTQVSDLAQVVPLTYAREDLVVPSEVHEELALAAAWIRHRTRVLEDWKFQARLPSGRGLTAIFHGPPGCGKTMAAQVLARDLDLRLLRVDLSQIMNKYIGETEKNLAKVFDAARASGAALFFDEADAVFGKRSEVRAAQDRYANLEISYLLQRMEDHDGVTILASNRLRDLDEAFLRRFHFIIELPMPDQQSRARIWKGMFPADSLDAGLDFFLLGAGFELTGGDIRNCALSAAFAAAAENSLIGWAHIKRAIRRELTKCGRLIDESRFDALPT